MEVTQKNFKEALTKIQKHLKDAEFIAFDTEMSGLGRSFGIKNHDLDTIEERYIKIRRRIREYGIIQIGISIFRFCQKNKKYHSSTYCFFLCGKKNGSYRYDASSVKFLAENGFDFNKLFIDGLPFMSLLEESETRANRIKKVADVNIPPSPMVIKDTKLKSFFNEATIKIKEAQALNEAVVFPFSSLTGLHRKILFNNIAHNFPMCSFKNTKDRDIEVRHYASETEKDKVKDEEWEEEFSESIGFAHVVKLILESNLPLVGHNMSLDLMHFVDKFIAPLPESYEEFKRLVRKNLPLFYDTKLLVKDPQFSTDIINTALESLYSELSLNYSPPEVSIEDGYHSYKIADSGRAHDGGYDAFMTGFCFLTMLKKLEGKNWGTKLPVKSKTLIEYANKINFMGSADIPFFDIDKPEEIPDRSFILSVDCPSTWTQNNIRNLFSKLKSYKFVWTSDVHFYVIPQDKKDIAQNRSFAKYNKSL